MTLDVVALVEAARRGDLPRVQSLTRGAPEADRRSALPELRRAVAELRRGNGLWGARGRNDAIGLALLACTTGAAAVTSHVTRWWRWGTPIPAESAAALLDREATWLPDVVARLADLPATTAGLGQWELVEALRTGLGLPRPRTAGYVHGLVLQLGGGWSRRSQAPPPLPLADRLRADAELRALVPVVLELDDAGPLGNDTVHEYDDATKRWVQRPKPSEDTWRGALAALCGEGLLDRAETIDGCLRVLLRGGTGGRGSFHLALLTDLDLDHGEVTARHRSFLQLLSEGAGPSVKHAQRALRAAADAGLLDRDVALEAAALVLARPEKTPAVAQLSWLDRLARQPGAVDDLLLAAAEGFAHERTDVQERAVAVVTKHVGRASPATLTRLVAAAEALSPSVRIAATPLLGVHIDGAAPESAVPLPAPRRPASWPIRGRDLGDLAEATAGVLERPDDPVLLESVLAGLARLCNADRRAFDAAMAPVRHRLEKSGHASQMSSAYQADPAAATPARLLRLVLLDPSPGTGARWRAKFVRTRHVRRHVLPEVPASPEGIVVARLREIAVRVMAGERGELVSTPSEVTGLLDASVLSQRLARLEEEGRQPWPADLQQALLRLPRDPGPEALVAAGRLRSPAGQALEAELRRGHLDPESRLRTDTIKPAFRWMWPAHPAGPVALAALTGPPLDPAHLATLALDLPDPFARAARTTRATVAASCGLWPATLPAHPEVLAAHALIALCDLPESNGHPALRRLLATLPGLDGPIGPAMAVAVCYALGASDAGDRTAASDAVVALAARGAAAEPVGRVLAGLADDTGLKLGRVAGALDGAARSAPEVSAFVWQVAAAALPRLLTAGTRDVHRLLGTAADAAAMAGARGEVPGLAEVAARGGTSRLVTEAKRLQRVVG